MVPLVFFAFAAALLGQLNPVPFVNQPLMPTAVAPGGLGFTVTVNGTGFVPASVVNWNGSLRPTTFVISSQLTAAILASDIATAGTASVTVTSPPPGGGTSNAVFFNITGSVSSPLFSRSNFAVSQGPRSVTVADFNHDGKLDLAVANVVANTVSILLGNGEGTFQSHVDLATGVGPGFVAVGDFNGDGNPDLAVTNLISNTVSILMGNGDGTFQGHVAYATGMSPNSAAVGDFNRDGKLDLAVGNYNGNTVSILLGNGDGTFLSHVDYPTGTIPIAVTMGDFNSDGKLDLAVANANDGTISILLGNGDGTFQEQVIFPTGGGPNSIATGDLNGDGNLDLVTTSRSDNAACVLLGRGDGTFQPYVEYFTGLAPIPVAIGDFNGDNMLDLVVGNYQDSTVSVLLGNGDGTFALKTDFVTGDGPYSLASADFNGDGRLDLAAADRGISHDGETVSVLTQIVPDATPPVVTVSANPTTLWPPNGKMVPVTISGTITDTGSGVNAGTAAYAVTDEYGHVQPSGKITLGSGGSYSVTVTLQASHAGSDNDGRQYTITVSAKDNAGNLGSASTVVTVPHDQGQ
jgi:hypothetical protein